MKKLLLILILLTVKTFAIDPPAEKATGVFLAFGVGPRLPLGNLKYLIQIMSICHFLCLQKLDLNSIPAHKHFTRKHLIQISLQIRCL